MSIHRELENNNRAVFRVSGQLGKEEFNKIQSEIDSLIQSVGNIKIMVTLENFTGWERVEGWEDTSFIDRNDPYIKKFAIVGDEKWQDLVTAFTLQGLRPVPIEYFLPEQAADARLWLAED